MSSVRRARKDLRAVPRRAAPAADHRQDRLAVGRRVDESQPWVDARLADGSRVNAIIRPCAVDGPALSIRKFSRNPLTLDRLVENGALTDHAADLLRGLVRARLNV
jgi:pilus assembly protein CpaF